MQLICTMERHKSAGGHGTERPLAPPAIKAGTNHVRACACGFPPLDPNEIRDVRNATNAFEIPNCSGSSGRRWVVSSIDRLAVGESAHVAASEIALIGSFKSKHRENEPYHDLADQQNGRPKVLVFRRAAAMNDCVSQTNKAGKRLGFD